MDNQTRKILLIDDDTNLLVTLSDFLRFEGYDVTTADSGEQGLKRLVEMTPDLIILDMSMPGMGGVGFLKEISEQGGVPKHPVLVLTARANMAEFFSDVDVDGFVVKPCDPSDLLMEVSRIIFLRAGDAVGDRDAPPEKRKLLLGEDDAAVSHRIAALLSESGYVVEVASKGPAVLEEAIVTRPDVVVLKLVLAGMNGDAVASMLKEMPNTRQIPVVLYDDSGTAGEDAKYVKAGGNIVTVVRDQSAPKLLVAVEQALN